MSADAYNLHISRNAYTKLWELQFMHFTQGFTLNFYTQCLHKFTRFSGRSKLKKSVRVLQTRTMSASDSATYNLHGSRKALHLIHNLHRSLCDL